MGLTYALAVHAARILQSLPGDGGVTFTEQLPASNASSNATAVFPTASPTATYDARGSAVPAGASASALLNPGVSTGGAERLGGGRWMGVLTAVVVGGLVVAVEGL